MGNGKLKNKKLLLIITSILVLSIAAISLVACADPPKRNFHKALDDSITEINTAENLTIEYESSEKVEVGGTTETTIIKTKFVIDGAKLYKTHSKTVNGTETEKIEVYYETVAEKLYIYEKVGTTWTKSETTDSTELDDLKDIFIKAITEVKSLDYDTDMKFKGGGKYAFDYETKDYLCRLNNALVVELYINKVIDETGTKTTTNDIYKAKYSTNSESVSLPKIA